MTKPTPPTPPPTPRPGISILPIPKELLQVVYLYDPTYREVFDIVLEELGFYFDQRQLEIDFLVDQEIDRNLFATYANSHLAYILGYSSDSSGE